MFSRRSSEDIAILILVMDAAAIDGFIEDVKMKPGAKLLM